MPTALDPTVGGSAANTYLTRAEATTMLDDRLNGDAWSSASTEHQDQALLQATSVFQGLAWRGVRTAEAQRLAWPRDGVEDRDGYVIANDIIPLDIKQGQAELALELLRSGSTDLFGYTGLEGFEELSVETVSITPRHVTKSLPKAVRNWIVPYLLGQGGFAVIRG